MVQIEKIISRDNRRLVHARNVRDRREADQIFIEGRRLVAEALRSGLTITDCFISEGFQDHALLDAVAAQRGSIAEISHRIFTSITDTEQPQGIVLIAQRPISTADSILAGRAGAALPVVVFLKEINNPSNLGAIMRTAEAAGVAGVVISTKSADAFSPKALRAAMGAGFRLPVWERASFDEVLRWAAASGLQTIAADASAKKSYSGIDWKKPKLLIFGSEAHGLTPEELTAIDEAIGIPMENGVESLNLAVSAGIILFEAKRQIESY